MRNHVSPFLAEYDDSLLRCHVVPMAVPLGDDPAPRPDFAARRLGPGKDLLDLVDDTFLSTS